MASSRSKQSLGERMKSGAVWIVGFVAIIWVVELINMSMDYRLNAWGIVPREVSGLRGIPCSPFLHAGIPHVLLNTIPFIILGTLVIIRGVNNFLGVSLFIILLGGLGVWIFGRHAQHVGASGLIFGYFGYLLARGWYGRDLISILIAVLVLILYGGMIWGMLPLREYVSFEGHLCGFIAGGISGWMQSEKKRKG
jgi:membrane associated rhomboid family serine protease